MFCMENTASMIAPKAMSYEEFLSEVTCKGIERAKESYGRTVNGYMLKGAIAGFEACRGKSPQGLLSLLKAERVKTKRLRDRGCSYEAYWEQHCKELEIEWTQSCVDMWCKYTGRTSSLVLGPRWMRATLLVCEILGFVHRDPTMKQHVFTATSSTHTTIG